MGVGPRLESQALQTADMQGIESWKKIDNNSGVQKHYKRSPR